MTAIDPIGVVQAAYGAFGRGDIASVLDLVTDDVVWTNPGPPDIFPDAGRRQGRAEVAQFFSILGETQDFERFEPTEFIAQGDRVVAIIQYRGRIKSTGRTSEAELVHLFQIRDGKIARFDEYFDTATAAAAYEPA